MLMLALLVGPSVLPFLPLPPSPLGWFGKLGRLKRDLEGNQTLKFCRSKLFLSA